MITAARPDTLDRRREIYREVLELVELEYDNGLTLDAVARRLATSRRQLQRVLAELGGTTLRELVRDVRMRKAREALGNGGGSVREVARAVGYEQAADFTKAFRRHHGVPPSEFRASAAAGASAAA